MRSLSASAVLLTGLSACMEAAPPEGYRAVAVPKTADFYGFDPAAGQLLMKDGCYYIRTRAGTVEPYFTEEMAIDSDYDGGPLCVDGRG